MKKLLDKASKVMMAVGVGLLSLSIYLGFCKEVA